MSEIEIGADVKRLAQMREPNDSVRLIAVIPGGTGRFCDHVRNLGGDVLREFGYDTIRIRIDASDVDQLLEFDGIHSLETVPDESVEALSEGN